MHDHQNRYDRFEDYVADKGLIFAGQGAEDYTVLNYDDPYGRKYAADAPSRVRFFSQFPLPDGISGAFLRGSRGFLQSGNEGIEVLPETLMIPGDHNRLNCLAAAAMVDAAGIEAKVIHEALGTFPGIPHRLEPVAEKRGVRYFNDSAATIPQASAAAIESFDAPVRLIAGGTDKELDFSGLAESISGLAGLYLLEGSATPHFEEAAKSAGISWTGPFSSLQEALLAVRQDARPGDVVLLSPGCTSFGMFNNEFHRGDIFRTLVREFD